MLSLSRTVELAERALIKNRREQFEVAFTRLEKAADESIHGRHQIA